VRRRRIGGPQAPGARALVRWEPNTDFLHLRRVVTVRYPVKDAQIYLQRNLGNRVDVQLVEARLGETPGIVRLVEVRHANSGDRTWVRGRRVLADGREASHFVPDHLVRVETWVEGASARDESLSSDDRVVLHVPARGYLRYLPGIFQGDGAVSAQEQTTGRDTALQKAGLATADVHTRDMDLSEDPLRRFMFVFQHVMTSVVDRIDSIADLTDPLRTDPKFIPWLASWVGFELDESLPIHQQRELVRRAIRLFRMRGTRAGIEEMVRVLTSAGVRIEECARPNPARLGGMRLIGGRDVVDRYRRREDPGAYLYEPHVRRPTSFFRLVLEDRKRFEARFGERAVSVLRRIAQVVSQERPTHVAFVIDFATGQE
jgi:phage tail-like protein